MHFLRTTQQLTCIHFSKAKQPNLRLYTSHLPLNIIKTVIKIIFKGKLPENLLRKNNENSYRAMMWRGNVYNSQTRDFNLGGKSILEWFNFLHTLHVLTFVCICCWGHTSRIYTNQWFYVSIYYISYAVLLLIYPLLWMSLFYFIVHIFSFFFFI